MTRPALQLRAAADAAEHAAATACDKVIAVGGVYLPIRLSPRTTMWREELE